jgi:hypothetical protein
VFVTNLIMLFQVIISGDLENKVMLVEHRANKENFT